MASSLLRIVRNTSGLLEKNFGVLSICANSVNNNGNKHLHTKCFKVGQIGGLTKRPQFSLQGCRSFADKRATKGRELSDSDSDSDSDDERPSRDRGSSAFWRRKMRTLHGIMDVNKDGIWSYDDVLLLTDRFTALGHLSDAESEDFKETMTRTWEEQWGEVSPYNLVTVEKYLEEMHHMLNDKDLKRKIPNFLPYLFRAVDKDKSGYISVEEFKLFFACLGLCQDAAAVSFAVIDSNQDGKVSLKEFVKHGRDFFVTEDETKISKMFWGPLLER